MDDFKGDVDKESCSKSINETVNGSHQFTIKGYSLAKGMGAGRCIPSDVFNVGGYDWAIYFYPDGKNPEDSSMYVSVFIALASEGTDVRALFELTLVDQSGKGKHKVHSHFDRALESGPYSLKYRGSMWGYKRFFRRTTLETSDYLKDDCLIMNCTVGVVRTRLEGPKQYSISVPPSDMGRGFKELLESESGCDIDFQNCLAKVLPQLEAYVHDSSCCVTRKNKKNSEGFRHLEESCPSMLCELLKTLASGDENSSLLSGRKRSGSSLLGVDLADGAPAESANPNGRRLRRRF
ncbi:hypothetical protein D5086_015918 [Populus alba]|uniref:Uncharacterized protein n=1 Tax=Populus alba TaxID=43335 RepID=A0ACC4BU70_POPAL